MRIDEDPQIGREGVCSEAAIAVDLAMGINSNLKGVHRCLRYDRTLLAEYHRSRAHIDQRH